MPVRTAAVKAAAVIVAVVLVAAVLVAAAPPTSAAAGRPDRAASSGASEPPGRWVAAASASAALPRFRSAVFTVTAANLPYSYRPGCPVPPSRLRMVHVSYLGFDGREHIGRIVVAANRTWQVIAVFHSLYLQRFPIASMRPVDDFRASDAASMAANNTSAFNCRVVSGSTRWSQHAYGTAIDVNPIQNPYVSGSTVQPAAGRAYLDRSNKRKGMITAGDRVVRTFADVGWSWGGYWTSPKDYQHFSTSGT